MSTRTNLPPAIIIKNVAGNMASDIISNPTILKSLTKGTYQCIWTNGATPVGTIALEGSSDYALDASGQVSNTGTWTTFVFNYNGNNVSSVPVSGNSGSGVIEFTTGINAIRIVYTAGSGSGTLTALITGKVS